MGTRYRYFTSAGGPPGDAIPPGLEPPQAPMFGPQFPYGPPPFGPPFGYPGFGGGPPPQPPGPMMCFPTSEPPQPPGPMMCFPNSGPPGPPFFTPGFGPPPPYTSNPWGQPMAVPGPSTPSALERPPPGARVNGELAKFNNKQGHIHSKNNTEFHVIVNGSKPWHWLGGTHNLQRYTCASSMTIDEFIEQVGAIERAPPGTPRDQIGVQEAIEMGNGAFKEGMALRLGDAALTYQQADGTSAYQTLEQLGWGRQRGQAGRGKPVTIAFLP